MEKIKYISDTSKIKKDVVQENEVLQESINKAMQNLSTSMSELEQHACMSFEEFLKVLVEKPSVVMRYVFQVFHDMVKAYVGEGVDEHPDDPESIQYKFYDCNKLLVEGSDHPFFADRLFSNRLVNLVEALKLGAQQNKHPVRRSSGESNPPVTDLGPVH